MEQRNSDNAGDMEQITDVTKQNKRTGIYCALLVSILRIFNAHNRISGQTPDQKFNAEMTLGGSIRSTLDGSDDLFRSAKASAPDSVRCYVNANYCTDSVLDICLMHIERNHLMFVHLPYGLQLIIINLPHYPHLHL
ncbi:conserved hypothetical protein [Trichinella spiralis]|uniref:hypothetical protein n=1 Tax=Trichinella spiralis TaxID=6334 RepID=UPI0001EFC718|nr:conserved hypothetical protein [Trichinella spiralis]